MTDLVLELEFDDSGYNADLNIATALSGHRIPLWLSDTPHEVLVTRVRRAPPDSSDAPSKMIVEVHCPQELDDLPQAAGATFLGWRVQSLTER